MLWFSLKRTKEPICHQNQPLPRVESCISCRHLMLYHSVHPASAGGFNLLGGKA